MTARRIAKLMKKYQKRYRRELKRRQHLERMRSDYGVGG